MGTKNGKMDKLGLFIFSLILILHGTYFRTRTSVEVPTVDWLIIARMGTCLAGLIVGAILFFGRFHLGFGATALLCYVLATGVSAVFSEQPIIVMGYFILLMGATMLLIALVYRADDVLDLERIEKVWFFTILVLVLKDAVIGFFFTETLPNEDVSRLGMGVTHANFLSFLSVLLFWISFQAGKSHRQLILWPLRGLLILILVGAVSRISIVAFFIGGLFYFLFRNINNFKNWIMIFSAIGFLTAGFLLNFSFDLEWSKGVTSYLRRGQNDERLTSFTGRTLIWQHAYKKAFESPLVGQGYGITRFTMGTLPEMDEYQPPHCHNDLLEVFLSTGLFGFIPYFIFCVYGLRWSIKYTRLRGIFSEDLALHAVCIFVMVLFTSIFESNMGSRLTPIQPLFFFYVIILDRESDFLRQLKCSQTDPDRLSIQH